MRRDAGITIVEVAAAVTVVAILLAILIPVQSRAARYSRIKECQDHLHTLHQAQSKAPPAQEQEIGRAYWVRLVKLNPPLVSADMLKCPFVEGPETPFCQYYGPAGDIAKLEAKDPIGTDMEQNHSEDRRQGGNMLLKSGEVITDHTSLWRTTINTGRVRP